MPVKNFSRKQETKASLKVENISRGMTFFAERKILLKRINKATNKKANWPQPYPLENL